MEWVPIGTITESPTTTVDVRVTYSDGRTVDETVRVMPGETLADALVARFGQETIVRVCAQ